MGGRAAAAAAAAAESVSARARLVYPTSHAHAAPQKSSMRSDVTCSEKSSSTVRSADLAARDAAGERCCSMHLKARDMLPSW
jgi:hypothetical protein